MKKIILFSLLSLVGTQGYSSETFSAAEKEMLLRVSDAYSQCAAYYEIAGALLNGEEHEQAKKEVTKMKAESESLALGVAEKLALSEVTDEDKAKNVAKNLFNSNYQAAIKKLGDLAKTDQNKLKQKIVTYSKGCNSAVSDPTAFTKSVLERLQKTPPQNP